jgi:hypothetical protein
MDRDSLADKGKNINPAARGSRNCIILAALTSD